MKQFKDLFDAFVANPIPIGTGLLVPLVIILGFEFSAAPLSSTEKLGAWVLGLITGIVVALGQLVFRRNQKTSDEDCDDSKVETLSIEDTKEDD